MPPTVPIRTVALLLATLLSGCAAASSPPPRPAPSAPAASRGPSAAARLGIPPGHLPPPGQCRLWYPGRPPGRQPKGAGACPVIERSAPAGSWIVYRPGADRKVVHVREVDDRRVGVVVRVRVYDAGSGEFLREEKP